MKPTRDPKVMMPPVANAANTPPTKADGNVRKLRVASRQLRNDKCSSTKIAPNARIAKACRFSWVDCSST